MREILFRGKRIDNGEWVIGDLCRGENNTFAISTNSVGLFEVIPDTTGQYTGVTDKNGVKIFEGDRYCVAKNRVYVVRYCNKEEHNYELIAASFVLDDGGDLTFPFDDYACEHGEVIGNIHDNPELFK